MHLELQQKSDQALRALRALQHSSGWCKAADLAREAGTTPAALPHVMRPLVHAGWVESAPGSRGGYHLVTSLEDISVLAVIEAVEGPIPDDECALRGVPCGVEPCALHEPWLRARSALVRELALIPVSPSPTGGSRKESQI